MSYKSNVMPRTIGGLLEDIFQNGFQRIWGDEPAESSAQAPVNIEETMDCYEMQLMAPGLKKEDFKINVDRNILTISYDHKQATEDAANSKKLLRREYRMQSFKRSFTLNDSIDASKISARYSDGILYISMPKKTPEEPQAQQINVG